MVEKCKASANLNAALSSGNARKTVEKRKASVNLNAAFGANKIPPNITQIFRTFQPNYVFLMRGTLMGMEDVNGDGERLIDLYQSGFWFHFKWIDHSAFRVTYFPFQVYTMMKMMMSTCKILTIQIRWNGNFYCLHKRPSWEATGAAESSLINLVFSMCVAWWSRQRLWIMWECNNSSFHSGW